VPVIPLGSEHSSEKNKLAVKLTLRGDIGGIEEELKALYVKMTVGDQTYEPIEDKRYFTRYDSAAGERIGERQYIGTESYNATFIFPIVMGGIEEFQLNIDSAKAGCTISPLRFVFKSGKYYRPYLFPGK